MFFKKPFYKVKPTFDFLLAWSDELAEFWSHWEAEPQEEWEVSFLRDIIRLQAWFWEWFRSLQILNPIPKTITYLGRKDAYGGMVNLVLHRLFFIY